MKYLTNIYKKLDNDSVICIGFFDGFHDGHLKVINQTLELAKKEKLKAIFFTFKFKFQNNKPLRNSIFTNDFKKKFIRSKNFDYYYEFDLEKNNNAKISKINFLNLLKNNLKVKKIILGENFSFAHQGKGKVKDLQDFFGVDNVLVNKMILVNNHILSSSLIKKFMIHGEIEKANKLLICNYFYKGRVTRHDQLGRKINFPTANISLQNKLLIQEGSYITKTYYKGNVYNSITYYAVKNNYYIIETHIINFDMNIYNKEIKVEFLKFLKKKVNFKNLSTLKLHINWCYKKALAFFKK